MFVLAVVGAEPENNRLLGRLRGSFKLAVLSAWNIILLCFGKEPTEVSRSQEPTKVLRGEQIKALSCSPDDLQKSVSNTYNG